MRESKQTKAAAPSPGPFFMPARAGLLQRACACGTHTVGGAACDACRKRPVPLQRRPAGHAEVSEIPPVVHDVLGSAGRPLDPAARAFMESRFQHDFSHVRVHTDARAAESALALNALAYTVGHQLVFAEGRYAPHTAEGRRLLAHELTHVVQQEGGGEYARPSPTLRAGVDSESAYEREADAAARSIEASGPVAVHAAPPPGLVQRVAPAAAGIGMLAGRCIVGAVIGAVLDLAIQAAIYGWRRRTWRVWGMTVDVCSTVLSAILGCIGGVVAARWLEPWINAALGPRLAGVAGPLIGRILLFIVNRLSVGIPRAIIKTLLKLGCISDEQAELIAPGVPQELQEEEGGGAARGAGRGGS